MGIFDFGAREELKGIHVPVLNDYDGSVMMYITHKPSARGNGWKKGMKSYREVVPQFAKTVGGLRRITQKEWDRFVIDEILVKWAEYYKRGGSITNNTGCDMPCPDDVEKRNEAYKWKPPVISNIDFYGIDVGKPFREHPIEMIMASRYLGEEGFRESYVLPSLNGYSEVFSEDIDPNVNNKDLHLSNIPPDYTGEGFSLHPFNVPLVFKNCSFYGAKLNDIATWSTIFEDDLFYNTDFKGSYLVEYSIRGKTPYAKKFEYCDFKRAFIEPPSRDNFPSPHFYSHAPWRGSFNGMQLEHCDFRGATFQYIFDLGLIGASSFRYSWFDKETHFIMTLMERVDLEGVRGIEDAKTFYSYINVPASEADYKANKSFWYALARNEFTIRYAEIQDSNKISQYINHIEGLKKHNWDIIIPHVEGHRIKDKTFSNPKPEVRLAAIYLYQHFIDEVKQMAEKHNEAVKAFAKLYGVDQYLKKSKWGLYLYLTPEGEKIAYEKVKNDMGEIRREMPDMKDIKGEWLYLARRFNLFQPTPSLRNRVFLQYLWDSNDPHRLDYYDEIMNRLPFYIPTQEEIAKNRETLQSLTYYVPGFKKAMWNEGNFIVPDYMLKDPQKYGIREFKELYGTETFLDYLIKLYPKRIVPFKEKLKIPERTDFGPKKIVEELKQIGEDKIVAKLKGNKIPFFGLPYIVFIHPMYTIARLWDALTYDMVHDIVFVPYDRYVGKLYGMSSRHVHIKESIDKMETYDPSILELKNSLKYENLFYKFIKKAKEYLKTHGNIFAEDLRETSKIDIL